MDIDSADIINGTDCIIAFGGNLNDPDRTFAMAFEALREAGLIIKKISSVITTAPVGCEDGAPDFRNGVLAAKWYGTARELLTLCQSMEARFGRPNDHAKGFSRTLDLDIILFGNVKSDAPELILPHPRAKERDFVMIPLREIAPGLAAKL